MLFYKKIKELEARVSELERRTGILADRVCKQSREIDEIHVLYITKTVEAHAAETPATPSESVKPKRKYRPRKKNGKENQDATK